MRPHCTRGLHSPQPGHRRRLSPTQWHLQPVGRLTRKNRFVLTGNCRTCTRRPSPATGAREAPPQEDPAGPAGRGAEPRYRFPSAAGVTPRAPSRPARLTAARARRPHAQRGPQLPSGPRARRGARARRRADAAGRGGARFEPGGGEAAAAQPPWPSSSAGTSRASPCGAAPRSSPSFSVRGCGSRAGGSGTVVGGRTDGRTVVGLLRGDMAAGGGGRGRFAHPLTPLPPACCSLWNQQHPLPAGHLPPRDLHPRPEVRAHPPRHHRPRAEELPQQRGGADERWGGARGGRAGELRAFLQTAKLVLLAGGCCARPAVALLMLLALLALQAAAVASFRVAVQVHRAAPGGGHLEYRKQ